MPAKVGIEMDLESFDGIGPRRRPSVRRGDDAGWTPAWAVTMRLNRPVIPANAGIETGFQWLTGLDPGLRGGEDEFAACGHTSGL